MLDTKTIIADQTGASAAMHLTDGLWSLAVSSAGWGAATLQHSDFAGVIWDNTTPAEGEDPIALSANRVLVVRGGLQYRLNVSSFVQDITMTARRLNPGAL